MNISELKRNVFIMANRYLKVNEERFTETEKELFMKNLDDCLSGKTENYDDEIYDFFVATGLKNKPRREEEFISHLNKRHNLTRYHKIMDVGAGRLCRLSESLAKMGFEMHAVDPNIRFSGKEAKEKGIASISKNKFICDYASPNSKGTIITGYDLLVGLEPCEATEHIIRQAMQYKIPFEILLCAAPHDSIDGQSFDKMFRWYRYLTSISDGVFLEKDGGNYYISNIPQIDGPELMM